MASEDGKADGPQAEERRGRSEAIEGKEKRANQTGARTDGNDGLGSIVGTAEKPRTQPAPGQFIL